MKVASKWRGDGGGNVKQGGWSMRSLMELLPESPSPICSSPSGTTSSSSIITHQNELPVTVTNTDKRELLSFLRRRDSDFTEDCMSPTRHSLSTLYESTLTSTKDPIPNPCHHYQELISSTQQTQTQTVSESEFRPRKVSRPRPYQEFLDEVQTQQHGAEIQAWKKANQLKLQNKLRHKEAAITNWEIEQNNKARTEMEVIERKIEIKRAKELKKMQQKIAQANKKAEKQRAHERQAALKKMARVARLSDKIQTTNCIICLKLHKLC